MFTGTFPALGMGALGVGALGVGLVLIGGFSDWLDCLETGLSTVRLVSVCTGVYWTLADDRPLDALLDRPDDGLLISSSIVSLFEKI